MLNKEKINQIIKKIHKKIFLQEYEYSVNLFLCGKNPSDRSSLRNLIYNEIKDNSMFNVVFPEWLFSDLLAKKEYNLLTLEHELASNVDLVIIPIEGLGTIAELGAFTSFQKLTNKILVLNEKRNRRKRSFINIGPIRLVTQENRRNLIYYDENDKDTLKKQVVTRLKNIRNREPKYEIKNLFNLSRFILYLIAIFQPVSKKDIQSYLENWKKDIPLHYIEPSLEILIKKERIIVDNVNFLEIYKLSLNGHHYIYEDLLHRLKLIKEFSQIRLEVLHYQNKKEKRFNLKKERERFLAAVG